MALCHHLDDYGAQIAATEAAYQQFVHLVDAILEQGPAGGRAQLVARAIEQWREQDSRLRGLLVELVRGGRVRLPRRMVAPGTHRHVPGTQGTIICATCQRTVPRLKYAEWQFAHNGVVSYRGNEFDIHQLATH